MNVTGEEEKINDNFMRGEDMSLDGSLGTFDMTVQSKDAEKKIKRLEIDNRVIPIGVVQLEHALMWMKHCNVRDEERITEAINEIKMMKKKISNWGRDKIRTVMTIELSNNYGIQKLDDLAKLWTYKPNEEHARVVYRVLYLPFEELLWARSMEKEFMAENNIHYSGTILKAEHIGRRRPNCIEAYLISIRNDIIKCFNRRCSKVSKIKISISSLKNDNNKYTRRKLFHFFIRNITTKEEKLINYKPVDKDKILKTINSMVFIKEEKFGDEKTINNNNIVSESIMDYSDSNKDLVDGSTEERAITVTRRIKTMDATINENVRKNIEALQAQIAEQKEFIKKLQSESIINIKKINESLTKSNNNKKECSKKDDSADSSKSINNKRPGSNNNKKESSKKDHSADSSKSINDKRPAASKCQNNAKKIKVLRSNDTDETSEEGVDEPSRMECRRASNVYRNNMKMLEKGILTISQIKKIILIGIRFCDGLKYMKNVTIFIKVTN